MDKAQITDKPQKTQIEQTKYKQQTSYKRYRQSKRPKYRYNRQVTKDTDEVQAKQKSLKRRKQGIGIANQSEKI